MGLAHGTYFALSTPEMKTLRGTKGDRARREHVYELMDSHPRVWRVDVEDNWQFLQHVLDPDRCDRIPSDACVAFGQHMHRGEFFRIERLKNAADVAGVLADIDVDSVREWFFAMDEEAFRYRWVPFWVADEWKAEGVGTLVTEARATTLLHAFEELRTLLNRAVEDGREVVFASNFKDGRY